MSWSNQTLGDYCEVIAGQSPEGKYYNSDGKGVPFYQGKKEFGERFIGAPQKWTTKVTKEAVAGDILMSVRAPVGPINFSTENICIGRGLAAIRPSEKLDKDFIFYYLLSKQDEIVGSEGAVFASINKSQIAALRFSYVELTEQKRIVSILDQAFADLEQVRAKTEQNLKNARELFDSYLQQVFSQKGEGWKEKKWGEMCKFIRGPFGGSLKKSMFKLEGYAVYEQKHAIHDHIEQLRYYVDEQKFEEMKRFELKPGELIMSCSGVTLGRASVIPEGAPKGIINQALLKLTANDDLDIHFLKYWIRSKIFQDIIFEHAGGAAIPNVPAAKILKEIKLQIPTIEKQKIIVSEIDSMLSKRDSFLRIYTEKLAALDELKKSILQKAFSGELTAKAE